MIDALMAVGAPPRMMPAKVATLDKLYAQTALKGHSNLATIPGGAPKSCRAGRFSNERSCTGAECNMVCACGDASACSCLTAARRQAVHNLRRLVKKEILDMLVALDTLKMWVQLEIPQAEEHNFGCVFC